MVHKKYEYCSLVEKPGKFYAFMKIKTKSVSHFRLLRCRLNRHMPRKMEKQQCVFYSLSWILTNHKNGVCFITEHSLKCEKIVCTFLFFPRSKPHFLYITYQLTSPFRFKDLSTLRRFFLFTLPPSLNDATHVFVYYVTIYFKNAFGIPSRQNERREDNNRQTCPSIKVELTRHIGNGSIIRSDPTCIITQINFFLAIYWPWQVMLKRTKNIYI